MKYYSEITKNFYDDVKECEQAESNYRKAEEEKRMAKEKKNMERAEDAKQVEAAYAAMAQAQNEYKKVLENFVKKHGSYHFTTNSVEDFPHLFFNLFNL